MQFRTDADLNDALTSPAVKIKGLLEVDWNRDGTFSSTVGGVSYADLSSVIGSVEVDYAALHSDLPQDVNTVVGSSSGVMKAVLVGQRSATEMRISQLLSRYYIPSPFYKVITVEGTPIRYSRQVNTRAGYKVIRQFTGWITDYDYDEATDETTLNCSDIFDLQQKKITLPVWASGPGPNGLVPLPGNGLFSPTHTINSYWAQTEALMQAGRGILPGPRYDAVAFWSCAGSLLPSFGYGSLWDAQVSGHAMSHVGGENGDVTFLGKYGYGSAWALWGDFSQQSFCRMRVGAWGGGVNVPDRGGSDPDTYISMSGWFYPGIPGFTGSDPASDATIVLDSVYGNDYGYVQLQVFADGSVWVTLHEALGTGSSNANTSRTWQYHTALPTGAWGYVEFNLHFTNSAIDIVTHINHVVATPTVVPSNLLAFKYLNRLAYNEPTNWAWIEVKSTPCQAVQICYGAGTNAGTYFAAQSQPPWQVAGLAQPAYAAKSMNVLSWLPDVDNVYAWDVLKDNVDGELGCLFTREDGTVWIMGKNDVNYYGNYPIAGDGGYNLGTPSFVFKQSTFAQLYPTTLPNIGDVDDLTRAKLQALNINPSAIAYRNDVSVDVDLVLLSREIVWQSSDAKQFLAPSGSTNLQKTFSVTNIEGIYSLVAPISATASADTPDVTKTSVSAVDATTPANPAAAGWTFGSGMSQDQRRIGITYGAGLLSPGPVYVGAILLANQANLQVGGLKFGPPVTTTVEWQNPLGITTRGFQQLVVSKSDWLQDAAFAAVLMGNFLLNDVLTPAPLITNLSVPVDPRRQLLDTVKLPPSDTVSGDLYGMVMGKRIYDTPHGQSDQVDIRVLIGPANTLYWDDPTFGWDIGSWG